VITVAGKSNRSKLPAATNAKRNTKKGRAQMPASDFGLPAQKKYRIDDPAHARDALARAAQDATPAQRAQIKRRVAAKFPSIGKGSKPNRKSV
jgi:hypothetical protein